MDKKLMPIAVSLLLFASCSTRKAELTYVADPSKTYQTIDNFGASDAWSMWTVGEMPQPTQERVARLLFSSADDAEGNPEGAGLSIWRYNIGAGSTEQGDSSYINRGTRTECFLNEDGTYNWDKQLGQRNFLKLAKKYGVPYLLGFLNSPPVYYTKNGLATNTGRDGTFNLQEDRYDDFARFMADVVQGLEKHDSVTLDYISPVNEPDGHWNWQGPKQEGTPATKYEIARIARLLDKELAARGMNTKVTIPESSDYRAMMRTHITGPERGYQIQSYFSPDSTETYVGDLKSVGRLMAGHSYWTNTPVDSMRMFREQLRDLLKKYGVDFWQSEVCIMGNDEEIGGGGGYDRTMKTALYVARMIHHDLVFADARSWQWWRAIGGDYKDGLMFQYREPGAQTDTIVDSRLLWSLGNYSRFVRPGAVRIDVTKAGSKDAASATDPYGLMLSAYRNADGSFVVVAINYSEKEEEINIDGLKAKGWKAYRTSDVNGEMLRKVGNPSKLDDLKLPPRSITTFVSEKP
ncbi:MAG: xylanase [Paramuribaculum sp.]